MDAVHETNFEGGLIIESDSCYSGALCYRAKEEWENIVTNPTSKLRPDVEYQLSEILYKEKKKTHTIILEKFNRLVQL